MTKKKWINLIVILFAFFGFVYIMSTIPFCSDDWAWGASVGAQRLASHFRGYNGRYLGNLLILLLTKSNFIKTIGMAVVSFSVIYLIYKYIGDGKLFYFLFVLFLLVIMPTNILRQTMAWASGLANYIPPIALTLLYLVIVKNIFDKDMPKYKEWLIPVSFVIGLCGNLFMEHVTIMNVVVSIGVIVYSYIKFKTFFRVHVFNFLGNICGAAIMFSNSAYGIISSGKDSYRSVAGENESFFSWLIKSIDRVCTRSVESNALINILISIMLFTIVLNISKQFKLNKGKKRFLFSCVIFDFAYTVFVFIKEYVRFPIGTFTSPAVTVIRCILATIFIISLIVVPLVAYEDKDRAFKAVMPILAESVLIVPLLVVSPVTGRCFYPPYVMFMLYSCELMKFIMQNYVNSDKVKKTVYALVIVGVAIGSVFYTVKYTQVKAFENERNSFVSAQIESGNKTVYLPHYPAYLEYYTEGTTPRLFRWYGMWETRYKDFYDIDQSVRVEPISYARYKQIKNK